MSKVVCENVVNIILGTGSFVITRVDVVWLSMCKLSAVSCDYTRWHRITTYNLSGNLVHPSLPQILRSSCQYMLYFVWIRFSRPILTQLLS